MAKEIDYHSIKIPESSNKEIDRTKWDFKKRRADLLQISLAAGSVDVLESTKICHRYGVSPGQISQDKTALRSYIKNNYGNSEKVISDVILAKQRSLKGALLDRNWQAADRISSSIIETCQSLGMIEKMPDKLEVESETRVTMKKINEIIAEEKV